MFLENTLMKPHIRKKLTTVTARLKRNERAHELGREHLSLELRLSVFDQMTSFDVAMCGRDPRKRARIRRQRAAGKEKIIARIRAIEHDPGYVVFEPYGA